MDREKILSTIQELPVETKVKAWIFQTDDKTYYQIVETNSSYGIPPQTLVWRCNKKGKRTVENPVYTRKGANYMAGVNEFLDMLESSTAE